MKAPQIIMICLFVFGFAVSAVKHGTVKQEERYNAGWTLISTAISAALLWWGGFWG